jgi:maltooligosyltrehalose synthase
VASDLVIDVAALREQLGRSEPTLTEMRAYARKIGCSVVQDEIECHTEQQTKKLATWWMERVGYAI